MANESLILDNRGKQVGSMLGYRPSTADATKPIPVEIPYSRGSDAMEFVNGLWQPVVKNMPRRYNDAWLNEPFATNIALGSQLLDLVTYWFANPSGTTADQGISPLFAASSNVHSWLFTAAGQRPFLYQNIALVNASVYTFSFNCESITGSLTYNDCVLVMSSSTPISSVVIKNNGVVKNGTDIVTVGLIEYTFNCNYSGSHEFRFGIGVPDVRTGTLQVSQPQLETGSVATSPIITEGAAVTRLDDVSAKTNCADIIGQTEGVVYVEVNLQGQSFSDATAKMLFSISDGTGSNRIEFYRYNNLIYYDCIVGGAVQFSSNIYTITTFTGQPLKLAISYILNNVKVFINGVLVNTDLTSLIPLCNKFNIGSNYTNQGQWNGGIKNSKIYPALLSDAQCIALTTI